MPKNTYFFSAFNGVTSSFLLSLCFLFDFEYILSGEGIHNYFTVLLLTLLGVSLHPPPQIPDSCWNFSVWEPRMCPPGSCICPQTNPTTTLFLPTKANCLGERGCVSPHFHTLQIINRKRARLFSKKSKNRQNLPVNFFRQNSK